MACLALACGGSADSGALGGGYPGGDQTPGSSSAPDDPQGAAAAHCVDLSGAPECVAGVSWPLPPAPLLEASQLGEGFEFVSLHDAVALARGPAQWVGVYVDPQARYRLTWR